MENMVTFIFWVELIRLLYVVVYGTFKGIRNYVSDKKEREQRIQQESNRKLATYKSQYSPKEKDRIIGFKSS